MLVVHSIRRQRMVSLSLGFTAEKSSVTRKLSTRKARQGYQIMTKNVTLANKGLMIPNNELNNELTMNQRWTNNEPMYSQILITLGILNRRGHTRRSTSLHIQNMYIVVRSTSSCLSIWKSTLTRYEESSSTKSHKGHIPGRMINTWVLSRWCIYTHGLELIFCDLEQIGGTRLPVHT